MLKKTIKYTDYNGREWEETYLFDLSQAELFEMQMTTAGGFDEYIQKIINARDLPELMRLFKKIILMSYGEKSDDGKAFLKRDPVTGAKLCDRFEQTKAYSELFMELVTDAQSASDFVNGLLSAIAPDAAAAPSSNVTPLPASATPQNDSGV